MKVTRCIAVLGMLFYAGVDGQPQTGNKTGTISEQRSDTRIEHRLLDGLFSPELSGPYATHGYVISFRPLNNEPTSPNIYVLQRGDSAAVAKLSLWFQGAKEVQIMDADVDARGGTVVVGIYGGLGNEDETSKPEASKVDEPRTKNFLTNFGPSGKQESTVYLEDYIGQRVCVAPDHSAWTLGISPDQDQLHHSYDLLRHYAPSGKLIGSYLPKIGLSWRKIDFGHPRHQTFLRCGTTAVAAYLGAFKQWFEIPYGRSDIHRYLIEDPGNVKVSGLAMVGPGEVYATLQSSDTRGLYLLSLRADGTGAWVLAKPVVSGSPAPSQADNVWRVIGQDGDRAVYFSEKHVELTGVVVHAARVRDILPASSKGLASKP